ncbi:transglutaminase domain-containing protein [Candidatus Woesearchaeota archaeon]|nr:transglutaminase domain-containing protein [Candidatus Woesearchaeota archaeon]
MEHINSEEIPPKQWLTPLRVIGALFLVLIIVLINIPLSGIKIDPEPQNVPGLEIIPKDIELADRISVEERQDFLRLINPADPVIKQVADIIAAESCDSNKVCQAKAIFYFVRDNFDYVSDPTEFEYIKSARESLISKAGDCDDAAILAANLMEAIGINTQFVFIPNHVYIQIYLPDALSKYKEKGGDWINLDPTCESCKFGEIPYINAKATKIILDKY